MDPNPEATITRTPDEQVAHIIVHELAAGELVDSSQLAQLNSGLASGTLRAVDWRLIAEKALELEVRHGKSAS